MLSCFLVAMATLKDVFPPPKEALELPPEELAIFILKFISQLPTGETGLLNRYNFTLSSNVNDYSGRELCDRMCKAFMEAWVWLERERFLAPKPGDSSGTWAFITRRGNQLLESLKSESFKAYQMGELLPSNNLDPVLIKDVRPLFIRGDYDTAVFRAFKEIEVRVRKAAKLAPTDIGTALMRKAFEPAKGALADKQVPTAEQEAEAHLFAGAIGLLKNPSSHRVVDFTDPVAVAESIVFANMLLRIVEERGKKPTTPVLSHISRSPSPS